MDQEKRANTILFEKSTRAPLEGTLVHIYLPTKDIQELLIAAGCPEDKALKVRRGSWARVRYCGLLMTGVMVQGVIIYVPNRLLDY